MRKALLLAGVCLAILMNSALAQVPQSQHVFVVVEEGNGYASVIGSSSMPYLNQLASQYGLATQYYANTTSPIANYFVMTTGQPITTSENFDGTVTQDNIVRHFLQAGKTWKSYAESLPTAGYTGADKYPYLKGSDPFASFEDVANSSEKMNLVPFTQFQSDLANDTLPNFSFIVPNAIDRMRDCPSGTSTCTIQQKEAAADSWLKTNIAPLLASKTFQQDGILFIVFNRGAASDTRNGGGQAAMLVIGPSVKSGYKSTSVYTHQNLLKTLMQAVGVDNFPAPVASLPSMQDFFKAQTGEASSSATTSNTTVSTTSSTTSGAVTISTPANGATVASPVRVAASATSTYPITAMRIYVDSVSRYAVNANYVNTSISLANGAHTIIVQAWNSKGTVFKSARSINVGASTTSSTGKVTVTAPSNGASVNSPATFAASATAKSGASITAMQIYVDGLLKYQVNAASLNTSLPLATGSHAITVQAWDNTGAYYKAPLTVNAVASGSTTTTAGKVTVSSPSNGATVNSPATFVASATAKSGAYITAMQIYVDGVLDYTNKAASLNTSLAMAAGSHAITVQAWDNTGAYYKAPLSVNVASTATTPAPTTATGTAYYVATNGSDSNPGTLSAPWRTIQHAANVLKPGQTVYVRGGTYKELVRPAKSGTASAWISYKNYPGEHVVIDGTGLNAGNYYSSGLVLIDSKSYLEFNGFEIAHCAGANGIKISGDSHYINLKNNTIHDIYTSGINAANGPDSTLSRITNLTITGNDVYNTNKSTWQEAISLTSVSYFEIASNKVHDNQLNANQIAIDVKVGTNGGSIHNNEVYNINGDGIYIDSSDYPSRGIMIYDNKVHNLGSLGVGIYLAAEQNGGSSTGHKIYNNLIYNNACRGFVIENWANTKQFEFVNNTLYNNYGGQGGIANYSPAGTFATGTVIRNNIVYGPSPTNYGGMGITVDHNLFYGGASTVGTGYVTSDPKFVSSTNFHLQSGSPAISAGSATTAPTTNFDGSTRSNPPNIGSY